MTTPTLCAQPFLVRLVSRMSDSLERHFWCWVAFFVVLLLACSIAIDLREKMWNDELFTLAMAQQGGPAEIVKAAAEGWDTAPLYAIIVRWLLPIVKHEALAARLPATLGYCGMILCLLAFCHRRLPAVYAFVAALLACDACLFYATDGRSYGIVLGCAAGALLCWQIAAEGRRRGLSLTLLAVCLALMIAMHYYSIFFLVPLFLAELARARVSRKLDFGILAATLPALLVLALHYPLMASSRYMTTHFWSPARWNMIQPFYNYLIFQILYVSSLVLLVLVVFPKSSAQESPHEIEMPAYEWVALGAVALMPPVVIAVSRYTTHVFLDRYILWAMMGSAVLLGALLCRVFRGWAAVGVTLLGLLVALIALKDIMTLHSASLLRAGEEVRQELEMLADSREPIVIPDEHVFMELSYYAQPRLRERFIYPISPELELRYNKYDSIALGMAAFSHSTKLHIEELDGILAQYPQFLLVVVPEDYLPRHLASAGYLVVPVHPAAVRPFLFEVKAPPKQ
jgi:hypothetical protein